MKVVNEALVQGGAKVDALQGAGLKLAFPGEPAGTDATELEKAVAAADAIVIGSPEYHGSYSAFTKLVIENLGYPSALEGKPVALLGVAGGRIGAIKCLEHLRGTCAHTGAIVLPGSVSIALAQNAFDADGSCTDDGVKKLLEEMATGLLGFLERFGPSPSP